MCSTLEQAKYLKKKNLNALVLQPLLRVVDYDIALVDEYIMHHPGLILRFIHANKIKECVLVGDRN